MKDAYIIYRCRICGKHFILMTNEVVHSEEESRFITCPFRGKHKDIVVINRFENINECMEKQSVYKKVKGRVKQIK